MDRIRLLGTLLQREQERRDGALAAWHRAERSHEQQREQASALLTYRGEYRVRWAAQFSKAAPMDVVRCYHGFLLRLDQAITAQQAKVEQAARAVKQAHDQLHHFEIKVATVRRMIERRQAMLLQTAQRREQKVADEAAQRRAWSARRLAEREQLLAA